MGTILNQENGAFKRLFFAFEIASPWPKSLPPGRLIHEQDRHLTVAFLGQADYLSLQSLLSSLPLPPFKVGSVGKFDKILFLPKQHPRVAAWHIKWLDDSIDLSSYVYTLVNWLKENGFSPDERKEWLPHVTLSRSPFDLIKWNRAFREVPLFLKSFHLYESLGNLCYQPVYSHLLLAPYEELDHTADIAFKIRGENMSQLFFHALTALSFTYPEIMKFIKGIKVESLNDVVRRLNEVIARTDTEMGCPFKAVSFHGEIEKEGELLTWEMIVDV